jgi:proteasome lid subunit RPN8/RPN11
MHTHPDILDAIREHGQATYPEECCGFLLGQVNADGNVVTAAWRVENREAENRDRRYTITPEDYNAANRAALRQNLDIVGFYHSHPDHPAQPSATDLAEATFPGYTYVIVSIRDGQATELTAWSLAPDRSRFEAESIDLIPATLPTS